MKTHVTGSPVLGELRHAFTAVFFGNPLFSPQEQLLANLRIHGCKNAQQLVHWLTNSPTALANRQRANPMHKPASLAGHVV